MRVHLSEAMYWGKQEESVIRAALGVGPELRWSGDRS